MVQLKEAAFKTSNIFLNRYNSQLLLEQYCENNLPILSHNLSDRDTQIMKIKQNFELVYFGNQYDSIAAIVAVYPELFETPGTEKLKLLKAASNLGIDIFKALRKTEIELADETVYFSIFSFESWLEIQGNYLTSLPLKYIPYLAVRRKNSCWKSLKSPLIKIR